MRPFPVKAPEIEIFHIAPAEFLDAGTWMSERLAEDLNVDHDVLCSDVIPAMRRGSGPRRLPSHVGLTVAEVERACRALSGWYSWACFPGCLPDSDPSGPDASRRAAVRAARDLYGVE